jgi:tRNA(Ile)-lysidine synthase
VVERLNLGAGATETRARAARREAFDRQLALRGARHLLTAHHADDQVETLLMRFARGSGPAGLAGMALRSGDVVRPLLPFTRAELVAHVSTLGLEPWHDPANADSRHDRAWVRARLVPLLVSRWPGLPANLLCGAELHREQRLAWDHLLTRLPDLDFRAGDGAVSVAAPPLGSYSSELSRALLRALARAAGAHLGGRQFDRMAEFAVRAKTGDAIDLGDGWRAEFAYDRLRLFRPPAHLESGPVALAGSEGAGRVGRWRVTWSPATAPNAIGRAENVTWVTPCAELALRRWRPGDRIRPLGGHGSRLVVRCMQDAKVIRSDRPDWPVLEWNGGVVWVPGVCRSDSLVPKPGAEAVKFDVSRD